MTETKEQQLNPKELEVRIQTLVQQRNDALDTIAVLNGRLHMAQEELKELKTKLNPKEG